MNTVSIDGVECQLTAAQIKLLDVVLPEDYENFKIDGLDFQKFDEDGLNLSKKDKNAYFLPTGKQGIVDTFEYDPKVPLPIYDTDLKPSELVGNLKQVEEALDFEGEEGVYEEMEDDFFAKLIQS